MQFTYKESKAGHDMLVIKTNQHIEVEYLFESESVTEVYIDGYDFPITSDTLYGLFVGIGDQVINLVELGHKADAAYPAIMREVAQEAREAADMERELSSPYLTGRI